jgi:hypothetical protein
MREMDHTTLLYFSVKGEEEDAEAVVLSFFMAEPIYTCLRIVRRRGGLSPTPSKSP